MTRLIWINTAAAVCGSRDQAERISICASNSRCGGPRAPCQNGNTREQPSRPQFHMRMIVHMKPCDATRGCPVFADAVFFRPGSNLTGRLIAFRYGMNSPADALLRLPSDFNYLPLRYSVSGAVPGQSRRHAVRSSLDPLSRGPLLRERKPMPSGILILSLRYKNEWRSRQYYEGPWAGFPSVPKVWRPPDASNPPERSIRLSQ